MPNEIPRSSILPQIIVAVVIALLVGGTSPWWWKELKGGGQHGPHHPPTPPPNTDGKDTADRRQFHLVSQGQEILKGSYTLDLDQGVIGGAQADADLWWEIVDDNTRYLNTRNSAELSLVGATDLSGVPNGTFLTASFAPAKLNGSPTPANQIPSGTVFLVKTNEGRYAKVRIEQYGIAAPGDLPQWPKSALLIRWETFARE